MELYKKQNIQKIQMYVFGDGASASILNIIVSGITHVVFCIVCSFYWWVGFHFVGNLQFVFLFSCWTFGFFKFLALLLTKLVWTFLYKPFQQKFLSFFIFFLVLVIYLRWLGYMLGIHLNFLEAAKLFSKVIILFYITIRKVWEFQFLQILAITCIVNYLTSHSNRCNGIPLWY